MYVEIFDGQNKNKIEREKYPIGLAKRPNKKW